MEAQNTLAGDGVGICDDLITLEITSPDVCDVTLIDLPGITTVPFKDQLEDIGDQIRRLILNIIKKQETINLVVVPCNVDIATTEALRTAHSVDPKDKDPDKKITTKSSVNPKAFELQTEVTTIERLD
ncbi:interferon-induced GTP-binding protein Mx-like [Salvelinus alpinus]